MTLLTGIIYPVLLTGIAQVVFPGKANGSFITKGWKNYRIQTDRTKIRQQCLFLVTAIGS